MKFFVLYHLANRSVGYSHLLEYDLLTILAFYSVQGGESNLNNIYMHHLILLLPCKCFCIPG